MHRTGQFRGQKGVDPALAFDAALTGEAGGNDFQAEMGFLAALRAGMMAGMEMGIIKNSQPLWLERGLKL